MKKKIISLCLVVVLIAVAAVGATLAYFTDTEQKTNTMVIGDVEINIEEACKNPEWTEGSDETKYIKFDEKLFTLFPIKNELGMTLFNKMVYTFNTSESKYDAYIRTIVLFEYNEKASACNDNCLNGIHFSYSNADYKLADLDNKQFQGTTNDVLGVMEVDGKKYQVVVFTDLNGEAVPYGEAQASLNGVWLDTGVTETIAAGWGEDIDIIVFSQAIQATGLTHAEAMEELGVVNADNLSDWIDVDNAVINDIFTHGAANE